MRYCYKFRSLPADFKGKTFSHIIGTTYTPTELFLVKKKIKGPMWLNLKDFKGTTKI